METIKRMTTNEIIATFILTDTNNDPNIPTVRGWLMDELEARNPEAFAAWLDSDDCLDDRTLYQYFN